MEKEFIPYKEAITLKELGFNEPCFGYYNEKLELWGVNPSSFYAKNSDVSWNCKLSNIFNKSAKAKLCTAPLYQQAFEWLREKYNLPSHIYTGDSEKYHYAILKKGRYVVSSNIRYFTHKEAELDCLKDLIEIVNKLKTK